MNQKTTIAVTFLTHIISNIGGVPCYVKSAEMATAIPITTIEQN